MAPEADNAPKLVMRGLGPRIHAVPRFMTPDVAHDPRGTWCGVDTVGCMFGVS